MVQKFRVDFKPTSFLISAQNMLLNSKKMKKFEKLLNARKKFAEKHNPYDTGFCAIANELLHIIVDT